MLKIGTTELLLILGIALIIFGPSRLPALGKMTGKALGEIKEYVSKISTDVNEVKEDLDKSTEDIKKSTSLTN